MAVITEAELVSYLREDGVTEDDVTLVVSLANGLILDEFQADPPTTWPTWTRILALGLAEAGWTKFSEESVDDWSGKRRAALAAMVLAETDKNRLAALDGRGVTATAYTVKMTAPLDIP